MRALQPATVGRLDRDGIGVHYEVYGECDPTVFLLMPDTIVHSHAWKGQIPFLARQFRVVVIDPRGNGLTDVPPTPAGISLQTMIDDAWAVLDEIGVDRAVLAGLCTGAGQALIMAAERPDRVLGVFAINPGLALAPALPHKLQYDFEAVLDTAEGWAKHNRHYWLRDWPGFAQFFFEQMFPEPHSTKQVEDCVGWALGTTAETMLLDADEPPDPHLLLEGAEEVCHGIRCPVLVVSGTHDMCQNPERGRRAAELSGGEHVVLDGAGHHPNARDPVKINLLLRDFVRRSSPPTGRRTAMTPVVR